MKPGEVLTPLERTIALTDMVAYAGATWDHHRMHYDQAFAAERGMRAPVVDGQVLGALMAEVILDHAGPDVFITALSFRFRSMVFAGDTVRVEGAVTTVAAGRTEIALRAHVGDTLVADGTAQVRQ